MAPKTSAFPTESRTPTGIPQNLNNSQKQKCGNSDRKKSNKRVRTIDARSIVTQSSDSALKNGQLNVEAFLKSREFEIRALQNGMLKAKNNLNTKALQKVPRGMRRRTASHNVKKLPNRLQKKAVKEMKDGNTPTVNPSKRKPRNSRGRIRAETAKRLGLLASKKRASKGNNDKSVRIDTREPRPKLLKNQLNQPPKPKSKFRKRQIHKCWLPTHVWHAKRARMTEPKNPLWRFAIPITPTEKSYRPTHRAGGARGAIAWDMSYMSTICLDGSQSSLDKLLKTSIGITDEWLWEEKGSKWRDGKRSWTGWFIKRVKDKPVYIAPTTVLWCPKKFDSSDEEAPKSPKASLRKVFVRVHPAAFLETWSELLRLSKLQRPVVHIQDLRFEIGSINITGPGSTETLLGILFPYHVSPEATMEEHAKTFTSLVGLTNPATLPFGAVLSFSIMDPRLRYPPRTVKFPAANDEKSSFNLLKMLSEWPLDSYSYGSQNLFDREARFKAAHLPSQKALNRRKSLEPPGSYISTTVNDPPIPIILLASRSNLSNKSSQGTWTLLAPWKCILPIWYGIVHYPLLSGGNPRFGGLQELRQINFEHGKPCFPTDYPGTMSGLSWETEERLRRKNEWEKRPRGKRVEWNSLDLGNGRTGEIGNGWSCDFEYLLKLKPIVGDDSLEKGQPKIQEPILDYMRGEDLNLLLSNLSPVLPSSHTVTTVHITLVGRGIVTFCARIYRLPQINLRPDTSSAKLREQWLSLLPQKSSSKKAPNRKSKSSKNVGRIPLNAPLPQRVRLLAQSLIEKPPLQYPAVKIQNHGHPLVPDEEDLIGFVTTGGYCLAGGKGAAIGSILVCKALEGLFSDEKNNMKETKLCIVRNSGEKTGRLARWEVSFRRYSKSLDVK